MKKLAIIGSALAGGAGQIIEALTSNSLYEPVLILDRDFDHPGAMVFGVPIKGKTDDLMRFWEQKEFDEAIIAVGGDLQERKRLYTYLIENSIGVANVIDPSVKFGKNSTIGLGNVILNNTYLGNQVSIGNNNYILNQCSFQHDTKIGDHNYFATNVTVGAKVSVGNLNRMGIKCILETRSVVADGRVLTSGQVVSIG